jgi:hypothetical protein
LWDLKENQDQLVCEVQPEDQDLLALRVLLDRQVPLARLDLLALRVLLDRQVPLVQVEAGRKVSP